MSEFPITANQAGRSLGASYGDGRKRRINPPLLEKSGLGTKPSDALPCCDQADCNSRRLRNGRTGWRFSAGHIIAQ